MRLIFLDVDGVLNYNTSSCWEEQSELDKECVKHLLHILEATGAKVVLSSSWRFNEEGVRLIVEALPAGALVGATPHSRLNTPRRTEILGWLQKVWPLSLGVAERIEALAVLDDDADADLEDGSFFKTDFGGGGLTKQVADRVIAHLMKESGI